MPISNYPSKSPSDLDLALLEGEDGRIYRGKVGDLRTLLIQSAGNFAGRKLYPKDSGYQLQPGRSCWSIFPTFQNGIAWAVYYHVTLPTNSLTRVRLYWGALSAPPSALSIQMSMLLYDGTQLLDYQSLTFGTFDPSVPTALLYTQFLVYVGDSWFRVIAMSFSMDYTNGMMSHRLYSASGRGTNPTHLDTINFDMLGHDTPGWFGSALPMLEVERLL